jgi:hypothetical protein
MSFWLWPRSASAAVTASKAESRVWTPFIGVDTLLLGSRVLTTNTVTNTGNLTLGTSLQPISGLTYTYGTVRDLISGHYGPDSSVVRRDQPSLTVLGVDLGRQVLQTHSLTWSYSPPLLGRLLSPRFSWTGGSNQNLQPSLTGVKGMRCSTSTTPTIQSSLSRPWDGRWIN